MRRSFLVLAVLAMAASVLPARALPGQAGGALASANVEFMANIPDVAAIGGRILGDTMYVTTSTGLRIYDLSLGVPVPMGAFALPHFENEDVDTNGEILLISADGGVGFPGVYFYVIDVRNKNAPLLLAGPMEVPDGHIASCINDCSHAWLTGSGNVYVIDLTTPSAPEFLGHFEVPQGGTHDVQVDEAGIAWVTGGGGLWGYSTADPLNPVLVASKPDGQPGSFTDRFILHNSARPNATQVTPTGFADADIDPGELLLVTEENWLAADNGFCGADGKFQTGWYHEVNGQKKIEKLDDFSLGAGQVNETQKPGAVVACSSHYFTHRADGIVSVAWYEQGIRFLDVSNPRDIKQVGYFMPAVTEAWNVLIHGDYLYTLDVARGIDVLKFNGKPGDPPVVAPPLQPVNLDLAAPSPRWGYACRIPTVA